MGRGLVSGIVWGALVTGAVLVVLALTAPMPTAPTPQAEEAEAGSVPPVASAPTTDVDTATAQDGIMPPTDPPADATTTEPMTAPEPPADGALAAREPDPVMARRGQGVAEQESEAPDGVQGSADETGQAAFDADADHAGPKRGRSAGLTGPEKDGPVDAQASARPVDQPDSAVGSGDDTGPRDEMQEELLPEAAVSPVAGGSDVPPAPTAPTPEPAPAVTALGSDAGAMPVTAPQTSPATAIDLPEGSAFARPGMLERTDLAGEAPAPRALPGAPVPAPPPPGEGAPGATDTAPAPEAVIDGPQTMAPPVDGAAAAPRATMEQPVLPSPEMRGPADPVTAEDESSGMPADRRTDPAVGVESDPASQERFDAGRVPVVTDRADAVDPAVAVRKSGTSAAPSAVPRSAPAAEVGDGGAVAQAPVPGRTQPADLPDTQEAATPRNPEAMPALGLPETGFSLSVPGVRTGRLPTVVDAPEGAREAARVQAGPTRDLDTELGAAPEGAPGAEGALDRFAMPFVPSGDVPLMSVILIDAGAEGLEHAALAEMSFPVTVAVDPTRPDAPAQVAAYRKHGQEVVTLARGLPAGATPRDLEVAMTQYLDRTMGSVAVLDAQSGGFQDDKALSAQMVDIVADTGHGLVTYERGLNSALRMAGQAGVAAATAYRALDDARDNRYAIRRKLDRALFKARQDGHVILVGHTYPETVKALYEWALEAAPEEVQLAPVSAVLRRP